MSENARPDARLLPFSRLLIVALLVLALAAPAWGGQPLLVRGEWGYAVELAGDARAALPLAPTAEIGDLRPIDGGWLAAAVESDAGGPRLVLLRGRGARVETLTAPATAGQVRQPRLVGGERLRGLVWLEGESLTRLAVRAAARAGDGWSEPVTIAPPGPGSQLGLAAAELADGSWLAAWAAYDGNDHEILWSRLVNGAWTPPRPAADGNEVPDMTPALHAAPGGGAWLAWSAYDGRDYRVRLARFAGDRFQTPRTVGPRGSLHPAFADGGLLLYQRAVPRAWVVAELDRRGEVTRAAAVESASPETPAVSARSDRGVTLHWPDGAATSAEWIQE